MGSQRVRHDWACVCMHVHTHTRPYWCCSVTQLCPTLCHPMDCSMPSFPVLHYLPAEKAMAPHSSTLAWKSPWTEEPGRLQSMGSLRVGHDWATSLSLFTFMHWRRKWQPTPVFLPGECQGRVAWWAAIYGVAQSWTRLKWLSSSSSASVIWFLLKFMHAYTFLPRVVFLQILTVIWT